VRGCIDFNGLLRGRLGGGKGRRNEDQGQYEKYDSLSHEVLDADESYGELQTANPV